MVATQQEHLSEAPATPRSAPHRRRLRTKASRYIVGILMSLPAFAVVMALLGIPILQAIYYSMTKWDGITSEWVGPATYGHELTNPTFWRVLENNGLIVLTVPVAMLVGVSIAYVLNQHVPGWRIFRVLIFAPTALSWVVIGMVAVRVLARHGSINSMLSSLGLDFLSINPLASQYSALTAVGIVFIWSMVGTNMIIFLTGFATLDSSLEEAARIDGASEWRIFTSITLPQMKRFMQFAFTITMISAFTALFSLIFVMTGGGPGFGTTTLEFFIYQAAFARGNFGLGAMLGFILFVIMALIGIIQLRVLRDD